MRRTLSLAFLSLLVLWMSAFIGCRTPEPTPVPRDTPRPTFTRIIIPTSTVTATRVPTDTPTTTATPLPASTTVASRATATLRAPTATRPPAAPPQPPREGGTWDFEGGWYDSPSGFEGRMDRVAEDWKFFRRRGQFGQATFNENKNPVNVHRGIRSVSQS